MWKRTMQPLEWSATLIMLANQLLLTKGNCQPKGNSEQQPDANRTLASDAAATQWGCSDVDGRRQTVGSLALGYLKGLPDLSRNWYQCRLSWEVARKQGTIEDPHFSEAGFESICACSLSPCCAIDYIGAMVIFGGAMLRTQRLHPWATTALQQKLTLQLSGYAISMIKLISPLLAEMM